MPTQSFALASEHQKLHHISAQRFPTAAGSHSHPGRRVHAWRTPVALHNGPAGFASWSQCPSSVRWCFRQRQPDRQSLLRLCAGTGAHAASVDSFRHQLPNGLHLEVLHQPAVTLAHSEGSSEPRPPLLFLHGAGHAAWCWQEHFMPYFGEKGWESFAVSMRGHGGSEPASGSASTMDEQIQDLASLLRTMQRAPILVAHSLGGIVAQRYLMEVSNGRQLPPLAGCALLTNSGPRKFMPTPQWFLEQGSPLRAARVFWYMLSRPLDHSGLVKDMLFSHDLPPEEFARYHELIKAAPKGLPIRTDDMTQHEPALGAAKLPPVYVLGAQGDAMIMPHQIRDAADFFGTQAVMLPEIAHDVMLDTRWHTAAKALLAWVQTLPT